MPKIPNWSKVNDGLWINDDNRDFRVHISQHKNGYTVTARAGRFSGTVAENVRTKKQARKRAIEWMRNNPLEDKAPYEVELSVLRKQEYGGYNSNEVDDYISPGDIVQEYEIVKDEETVQRGWYNIVLAEAEAEELGEDYHVEKKGKAKVVRG